MPMDAKQAFIEQNTPLARMLVSSIGTPSLSTDALSEITGVPAVTIRAWIKRGHIELRTTERPGTGKAMLFSFHDAVEIMALSQLARLGIAPGKFAAHASETVMSTVMQQISELAGVWGTERIWEDNMKRFVVLYHSVRAQGLDFSVVSDPINNILPDDSVKIVFDCRQLAVFSINRFRAHLANNK